MGWRETIAFLEVCWSLGDDITKPFPIDAAIEFGPAFSGLKPLELIEFLSQNMSQKFGLAPIYCTILNSFLSEHPEVTVSQIPPNLLLLLCLYFATRSIAGLEVLAARLPVTGDFRSLLEFLDGLNANSVSSRARLLLTKCGLHPKMVKILCQFLIRLTPRCSAGEAAANATACVEILQGNIEENESLLCELFASHVNVDVVAATQTMTTLISSLTKGWFIFASSVKLSAVVAMVFGTLAQIKNNLPEFLQFAAERLPEVSDKELCTKVLGILAAKFAGVKEVWREFPPKCRLFDFVAAVCQPNDDDSFQCLTTLIPIPPIGAAQNFPVLTSLILRSSVISTNLRIALKSAMSVAESPLDFQLLIEPFVLRSIESDFCFDVLLESLGAMSHDPDISMKLLEQPSLDAFLLLLARAVGLFLPIFERTYSAILCVLTVLSRLSQRIAIEPRPSLEDVVKCIASMFNSQCLFVTASLLCENLTESAISSFLILFNERESELLHCVQSFVSILLKTNISRATLLFDENETLAKAATAMLTVDHWEIIRDALVKTKFAHSIVKVLTESPLLKRNELRRIVDDVELGEFVKRQRPVFQFVLVVTDGSQMAMTDWNSEERIEFLELVEAFLRELPRETQLQFASCVCMIEEAECIAKSTQIFGGLLHDLEFLSCFATTEKTLPVLLANSGDVRAIVAVAMQNPNVLSLVLPVIHSVLFELLTSQEMLEKLLEQKEVQLLSGHLATVVSAFFITYKIDRMLVGLIEKICDKKISQVPSTYVDIMNLMDSLEFREAAPQAVEGLLERARRGHMLAVLVLAQLCKIGRCDHVDMVMGLTRALIESEGEDAQAAGFACLCCFPCAMFA
jgi:hypothetical protein